MCQFWQIFTEALSFQLISSNQKLERVLHNSTPKVVLLWEKRSVFTVFFMFSKMRNIYCAGSSCMGKMNRRHVHKEHLGNWTIYLSCGKHTFNCTAPNATKVLATKDFCWRPFTLSLQCPRYYRITEIQRDRFQHVVEHVPIVEERRSVVLWKSTPVGRWNKRRRS